jgi:hypothetical protein
LHVISSSCFTKGLFGEVWPGCIRTLGMLAWRDIIGFGLILFSNGCFLVVFFVSFFSFTVGIPTFCLLLVATFLSGNGMACGLFVLERV